MANESKAHMTFTSAQGNPFWEWDNTDKLHMTFLMQLDHKVDGDKLLESMRETYEVWPLLKDAFIEDSEGMLSFVENDKPLQVFNSPALVAPGAGMNADRLAAVTYYEDKLGITGMHSFFDGGSVQLIMSDMLSRYFKKYYGSDLDTGFEPLSPGAGDKPEYATFYAFNKDILSRPFEYRDPIDIPQEVFKDLGMDYGPNLALSFYVIEMPSDEFIAYCKKHGASPSIMMYALFAQTVKNLHPENELPITANNTMNIRRALGLDLSLSGQTMGNLLVATKEDMDLSLSELCQKVRESFNKQRELDFMLSRARDMANQIPSLDFKLTGSLQYMGRQSFGEATKHLLHYGVYEDMQSNVLGFELNGVFSIELMLGTVGKKYADEMCAILNAAGVNAKIAEHTEALPSEIR